MIGSFSLSVRRKHTLSASSLAFAAACLLITCAEEWRNPTCLRKEVVQTPWMDEILGISRVFHTLSTGKRAFYPMLLQDFTLC